MFICYNRMAINIWVYVCCTWRTRAFFIFYSFDWFLRPLPHYLVVFHHNNASVLLLFQFYKNEKIYIYISDNLLRIIYKLFFMDFDFFNIFFIINFSFFSCFLIKKQKIFIYTWIITKSIERQMFFILFKQ